MKYYAGHYEVAVIGAGHAGILLPRNKPYSCRFPHFFVEFFEYSLIFL